METDLQRLNQILKNLLSNSFKFTEKGEVKLKIYEANRNWKPGYHSILTMQKKWLHLPSLIPVLEFRRKNRISFSKHFSRQKDLPAVNMEEQDWAYPSAVDLQNCLGGTIELESEPGTRKYVHFVPACRKYSGVISQGNNCIILNAYEQIAIWQRRYRYICSILSVITNEGIESESAALSMK